MQDFLKSTSRLKSIALSILTFLGISFCSSLSAPGIVFAEINLLDTIHKAEAQYSKKHFEASASLYTQALESGAQNAYIYSNLGNCYLQSKQFGKAIVFFRKALQLRPGNNQIKSYLQSARNKVKNSLAWPASNHSAILTPAYKILASVNKAQLKWVFVITYAISWVSFLWVFLYQETILKLILPLPLATCLFSIFLLALSCEDVSGRQIIRFPGQSICPKVGVITSAKVKAFAGASDSYQIVFMLYDGAEVEVLSHENGWVQVGLPNKRIGWVSEDNLLRL